MLKGARVWRYRFIPAQAGNTTIPAWNRLSAAVHPRAGGEHVSVHIVLPRDSGSSPRRRGTPCGNAGIEGDDRFIPAQAGNTAHATPVSRPAPVHPRAGGEHTLGSA
ncbi:Hypothetical protein GbCGDNIH5_1369 [Granulibacter bethesdensis]|nr:Hypothetical protein GbCGDNIH5_1369 [Granulibacter bethesdensis]